MATVGVDYGITGQVACRMVFGIRGAKWLPSIMRTIASAYWFAMQTIVGATVFVAIAHQWTGRHYSVVRAGLILASVQVVLALVGYQWLKLISRFSLPVKVAGILYLFFVLAHGPGANYRPAAVFHFHAQYGWAYLVAAVWLNSMTASWLTMITDAADFCRYTRSRKDMWWGTMLAGGLATALSVSLGAYGAAASLGRQAESFFAGGGGGPALGHDGCFAHCHRARRKHDQCDEPLHGRPFPLQHVRGPGAFLEHALCWRRQYWTIRVACASGTPGSIDHRARQLVRTGRGGADLPLSVCRAHAHRRRLRFLIPKGIYHYWHGVNVTAILWCFLGGGIYYVLPTAALPAVIVPLITGAGYLFTMRVLARRQLDSGEAKRDYELQASSGK